MPPPPRPSLAEIDTRSRGATPDKLATLHAKLRQFPPVKRRERNGGWSISKQRIFIQTLMTCGSVAHACKAVGMSREGAYALRYAEGAEGFADAWEAALALAAQRLADAAYERVLEGEVIPHFYKGELVGERVKHDNRLLMFLLRTQYKRRFGRLSDIQGLYDGDAQLEARVSIGANLETLTADEGQSEGAANSNHKYRHKI